MNRERETRYTTALGIVNACPATPGRLELLRKLVLHESQAKATQLGRTPETTAKLLEIARELEAEAIALFEETVGQGARKAIRFAHQVESKYVASHKVESLFVHQYALEGHATATECFVWTADPMAAGGWHAVLGGEHVETASDAVDSERGHR